MKRKHLLLTLLLALFLPWAAMSQTQTVLFSDDFEGSSCDWQLINGSQTNQWAWGTAGNNGVGHSLYISNDGGEHNTYTVDAPSIVYATKLLSFATSDYYSFEYTWKNHGEGVFGDTGEPTPFDYLRVVLAPSTVALTPGELPTGMDAYSLPEGWMALDGGHCLSGQDEWMRNYEETYLEAGLYTMVLVWCNDGSGGWDPAVVDDVSISLVSCPKPTGLVVNEVTNDYVAFTFDSEVGAVYQYCIVAANSNVYEYMFEGNTTSPATGTVFYFAYPLNGFNTDTDYAVYVRRKCGEDDYSTLAAAPFTTLDQCAEMPTNGLYYTEDFEGYDIGEAIWGVPLSGCWDAYNSSTDELCGMFPLVNVDSNNGNKRLYFASVIGGQIVDPQDQYAILPPMEDVNHLKMTFNAKTDSDYISPIHVGVMEGKDPTTFTSIADFNAINNNGQYTEYTVSFENYTGNGNRIAIKLDKATEDNSFRVLYVDNITVELNCHSPINVAVSSVTSTMATADWGGSPAAQSYTVRYRTATVCGEPSFSEGFENGLGEWYFSSLNEANGLNGVEETRAGIHQDAAHSGTYGFRFSSFQNIYGDGDYWQYLTSPEFELDGPSVLRFYYKKYSNLYYESLYVGYITDLNNPQEPTFISPEIHPTEDWQCYILDIPSDAKKVFFSYYGPHTWYVYLDDITIAPACEWQYVNNIAATTITLSNLTMGTEYDLQVKSDCSDEWSQAVLFTTQSCEAPTDVVVSNVGHYSAQVDWEGESDSYTVSYREAERPEILHEEDFDSNSIPSEWSTYTGLLNDVMDGTAQLVVNTATNYTNWRMANTIFGAYSACCNIYATSNKWLVTPEFTFNTSGSLSFDLAQTSYNNSNVPNGERTDDRFIVLIFSDDQWTILREWNNTGSDYVFNDITNTCQTISDIDLSAYVGRTVKIAFYGESTENNGDNDIHIDNVAINVMVPATPWQTIPDIAATTYDLTNLTAGTEYEVKVQAACGEESEVVSFATLSNDHKIFVTEGYWNNDSNWIPYGAPTIDQDVELRADVTIPSGYLATANQIEETWEHGITIEDGGQLYHTNYLLATVKKHVGGYGQENQGTNNGYILLAQPIQYTVSVEPNDGSNIRTGVYDFYAWNRLGDNEGKEWVNYGASNSSGLSMEEGKGYLYASQDDRELTFLANIRGNAYAYPINNLEYTAPTTGAMFTAWHLIGNSFACNVYLTNARTNGSPLPFYKMNAEGNGFEAAIGTTIAPMEGVFYEKPASTASYQPWFTRTQPTRSSNINISLAQGSTTATIDNAIIRFDDGETMGKLSFREGSSKVYIPVEGKDLAVAQAEGQVGEFPVNFKAVEDGTYTLSFTSEEVEFSYLHLIDNLIGNDVDLLSQDVISTEGKKSPSYTFAAKTTDDENRFKLVFATDGSQVDHLAFEAKDAGGLRSAVLTPHVPDHQQTENQDADLFVQAISLVQGWNWWAPMAKISAAQLRTVLGSTLLELKAKEGDVAADADLMPGKMYKLQTSADVESVVNGVVAPASNISEPGVYWIGYTGETSSSITQALVSVNIFPNAGDKIISQDGGFAIFVYPGWTWQGTLTELRHGQGYVYIHVASGQ